jgi:peptidoglycan hydrolase-like protein with peptidoglycan-binding domain
VAVGDDPKVSKGGKGKGFAGLNSLASDVDFPLPTVKKADDSQRPEPAPSPLQSGQQSSPASSNPTSSSPTADESYRAPYSPPNGAGEGSSVGKWILGFFAVIGAIWIIGQGTRKSEVPASDYSHTPSYSSPSVSAPQAPSRPVESKPSVGQNNVLSIPEIQYCMAEDIRTEGARAAIDNYNESHVDRFNVLVADFNSRCGEYRYQSGTLETARRAIEPYRAQYQAEGRARFISKLPPSLNVPKAPDPTVLDVQTRLNELGYNAGGADGFIGQTTRKAILAFQRDNGLTADGVAVPELLVQLIRAKPRAKIPPQATLNEPKGSTFSPSPPRTVTSAFVAPSMPSSVATPGTSPPSQIMRPDLSKADAWEQEAIENACGYAKRGKGLDAYYECLREQMEKLSASSGRPDLGYLSEKQKAAVENKCIYYKQNNGPSDYYECLRKGKYSFSKNGTPLVLSSANQRDQAEIEYTCGYHKQRGRLEDFNDCVRREMTKHGY